MKRLSIIFVCTAALFGVFSQSFATPDPMQVEQSDRRIRLVSRVNRMAIEQQEEAASVAASSGTQPAITEDIDAQVVTQYQQVVHDATRVLALTLIARRNSGQ